MPYVSSYHFGNNDCARLDDLDVVVVVVMAAVRTPLILIEIEIGIPIMVINGCRSQCASLFPSFVVDERVFSFLSMFVLYFHSVVAHERRVHEETNALKSKHSVCAHTKRKQCFSCNA